uniref:RRM domain-containing protein n=1 Tax=Plectus sambesii TaxID=2011161 RepID=A0A914XND7_9BILA
LAYNIQSGKVWEVFALAGKVNCVDLQLDKEGKSKGLGVIEYSHPIEAVQAISMLNNQRLYDRTITVKMDKYEKPIEKMPGELPRGLQGVGMGLGANGAPLTDIASVLSSVNPAAGPGPVPSGPMLTGPTGGGGYSGYGSGPSSGFGFGGGGGASQGGYSSTPSGPQGGYGGGGGGGGGGPSPGYGASSAPQGGFGGNGGYGTNGPMQGGGGGGYSSNSGFGGQSSAGGSSGGYGGGYQTSGGSMDGGAYGRMGGMGGDFGDRGSIPISHSPSRAIIINNLPPDYTWQIVRDRTRQYGDVEFVDIIVRDRTRQYGDVEFVDIVTPGSCKVRFKNIADAERARGALQGTTVEGRVIAVDFLFD